jgi:hypothetical protein
LSIKLEDNESQSQGITMHMTTHRSYLLGLLLMLTVSLAQAHGPRGGYRHGWGYDPWFGPMVVGTAMVGTSIYLSRSYPVTPAPTVIITSPPVVVNAPQPAPVWAGVQAAAVAPVVESYYCRESGQFFPAAQTCVSPWLVVYPQR